MSSASTPEPQAPAAGPVAGDASVALCRALLEHLPEILDEWVAISDASPWLALPADDPMDEMPAAARALIDASLCTPSEPALRELVAAAAKHGEDRRAQEREQELLFREYYLLRAALWRYVRRLANGDDDAAASRAIMRVDAAITLSTRAALIGFHRSEAETAGRWPAALDAIADEAAVLAGR